MVLDRYSNGRIFFHHLNCYLSSFEYVLQHSYWLSVDHSSHSGVLGVWVDVLSFKLEDEPSRFMVVDELLVPGVWWAVVLFGEVLQLNVDCWVCLEGCIL